ncbi:MAG: MopE-related protein, partial [Myxococcota bacterium]|nr:MopE-related protein [Myxococcota bacterium]
DGDASVFPGAAEMCDGLDNDCDGALPADEVDDDGDGYLACGECDDGDAASYPGAAELCDGIDNDCDGALPVDEADADGDGEMGCAGDCDDGNPDVYTAAPDLCDGVADNDCDGVTDPLEADVDGDGYSICDDDCDDGEPLANPGLAEICNDWIDNDCDGAAPGCGLAGTIPLALADAKLIGEESGDKLTDLQGMDAAGDVNGDGIDDVIVGAQFHDAVGTDAGAAYLVLGPLQGTVDLSAADAKLLGEGEEDHAGSSVAGVGDTNGDGYDDLMVGAGAHDGAGSLMGAAYLVLGPVAGTVGLGSASAKLEGEADGDRAGFPVARAGDVNGDGFDDVLVAARMNDAGGEDAGAAYLLHGPLPGGALSLSAADARFVGEAAGDEAGLRINGAGDLDGDGYDDLLIGAWKADTGGSDAGAVYVIYGPVAGDLSLSAADARLEGEAAGDFAGNPVAAAGDVDGDGFGDILVGARGNDGADAGAGAAYLLYGPVYGTIPLALADARLLGETAGDNAGVRVAGPGDVDGDGLHDLLIGALNHDGGGTDAGAAYLLYGAPIGTLSLSTADAVLTGEAADDGASKWLAGPLDVDGDGYFDLLISAHGNDAGGTNAGAAYVVLGGGM